MTLQTRNAPLKKCDVLIVPADFDQPPVKGFVEQEHYEVSGQAYILYLPQGDG
jgi:hypothetical protein